MQMVILTLDQDNSRIKILQLDIKLNNRTKIDNVHVASWLKINLNWNFQKVVVHSSVRFKQMNFFVFSSM